MSKNIEHSVRTKLLNISHKRNLDYNIVLIWYALERLLYRLSKSKYSNQYILKGAMLFSLWSQQSFRPTKDMDLMGYGDSSDDFLKKVFTEIAQMDIEEDGLEFIADSIKIESIRSGQEYGGQRINMLAKLGNARIRLQIDIGFGDAITPSPQKASYPTLLNMASPEILTYNRETVIAEKFHAMTILGIGNSRMKDFYDLWFLSQQYEFKGELLYEAIEATFRRRQTELPAKIPLALKPEFQSDKAIQARWNAFIKKSALSTAEKSMEKIIIDLDAFFVPIIDAFSKENTFKKHWDKQEWR